jgi:glycosyltransferase involved in cell wall biosynthesis
MTTNNRLTIAVVLISYNQFKYIVDALEGIRSQTREPDEVVIADDGSSDGTQQLIIEFVHKYQLGDKWKLLLSSVNRGINVNLQNAFDHTTSQIIIGMAGDDISLSNRCEQTELLFLKNPTCAMVSTSGHVISEAGTVIGEQVKEERVFKDYVAAIKHGNPRILPVGHAYRREVIYQYGPLPVDVPNEDDQITFRGLLLGGIACSPVKTYKYRIHNQSASAWLHKPQSSKEFMERFKRDISFRTRHMHYWNICLQQTNLPNRESLSFLLRSKADFFKELHSIDTKPIYSRVLLAIKYRSVTSFKDSIYLIFGHSGIIFWWSMRRVLRRV